VETPKLRSKTAIKPTSELALGTSLVDQVDRLKETGEQAGNLGNVAKILHEFEPSDVRFLGAGFLRLIDV
jgi:hypothetical protein